MTMDCCQVVVIASNAKKATMLPCPCDLGLATP